MAWEPLRQHSREPAPIVEGLDELMQRLSGASLSVVETVMEAWPEIVGAQIAAASSPAKISRGCLTIRTTDAVWASELQWLEATIVKRIAALVSDSEEAGVTSVRVVVRG